MFLDRTELLNAIAYYTRFNFSEEGLEPALPSRDAAVAVRSLMAVAYALCGGIVSWLIPGTAAGRLFGAVFIIAAHLWLTKGRDFRRPLEFIPRPGVNGTADEARQGLVTIALFLPAVAVLLLVLAGSCYAIVPVMSLGAAVGCEITSASASAHPFALKQPRCWGMALLLAWLSAILCAGSFAAMRSGTLRLLLLAAACVLLTPWLRAIPCRPAGRAASILLGEALATVLFLLIACF